MNTLAPELSAEFLRECHRISFGQHLKRLAVFITIYGAAASTAVVLMSSTGPLWQWIWAMPCYLLAAAALHGISLFTHEAVHGTLFPRSWANGLLGALCALPVWQNYSAYRVLHLRHHQHLGDNGDPDHYANYTRWSWMVFIMNWLRLLIGYPFYITAIPLLGLKHGSTAARMGILAEVAATVLISWAAFTCLPTAWLLHGWLIPMLLINTMVNIRGMSQHTLLEHSDDTLRGTRSILTSSPVRFFMCNENYHLEHHLYPGVPWHHLPRLHAALEPSLRRLGAPYISSYSAFVREFFHHSVQRSPLGRHRSAHSPGASPPQ